MDRAHHRWLHPDENGDASIFFVGASSIGIAFVPTSDIGAGPGGFTAGTRSNVTVRVLPPCARVGEPVRIGFHGNGRVRVLERNAPSGGSSRQCFDEDGNVAG
jgi:hypothetical protein